MSRRFLAISLAVILLAAASSPAIAARSATRSTAHTVYDKSSKVGSLTVLQGLLPAHHYSIKVISEGHTQFTTTGFQNFVYVVGKHAVEDSRTLALKGKTPYSFTLKQPVSKAFREWTMAMTVTLTARQKLTVRVVDLGKG